MPSNKTTAKTTLLLVAVCLPNSTFIQYVNHKTTDGILAKAHFKETSGSVVIVEIDDKSLDEYGQWPWPRYRLAQLLSQVQQRYAKSIGLTMVFAEPERFSADMVLGDGMDGLDTYRQILAGNSKQKIIIASGYLDSENAKEVEKFGVPAIKNRFHWSVSGWPSARKQFLNS